MMTNQKEYLGYFARQYKYKFSSGDVRRYQQWIYPQWLKIKQELLKNARPSILEIGCAVGGLAQFIRSEIPNVSYSGLELDYQAVEYCKKTYPGSKFYCQSLEEFNSHKKFDFVIGLEVLEHLKNPEECIIKIHQVLKSSGCFIGTSPYPFTKNIYADSTHRYVLHPENWKKLFYAVHFNSVATYPLSFLPFLWRISKHLNIVIPAYLPFNYFISTTLIVARKAPSP